MLALITAVSPACPRHSFQLNDCVNTHCILVQTVSVLSPFSPVIGNCEIKADGVLFHKRLPWNRVERGSVFSDVCIVNTV